MPFIASVQASFGGDTKELQNAAGQATGVVEKFAQRAKEAGHDAGESLGEIGMGFVKGFLVTNVAEKILGFFESIKEKAHHLHLMYEEFGILPDAIQLFDKAVVKAGGSLEQAQKIWEKARDSLSKLADGDKTATDAFAKLELSAKSFLGLTLDQALEKIARAYEENKDQAGAYAAYMEILGKRAAPQLMAALEKLGSEGFDALREQNQNLSDMLKGEASDAITGITLKVTEYSGRMKNFLGNIAGGFLETLQIAGGLGAAAWNWVQGVKTDWDEVLFLNKKNSAALEQQNVLLEKQEKLTKAQKEALDEATAERVKQLETMASIAKGHERLNLLAREHVELMLSSSSVLLGAEAQEHARVEAAKVLVEIKKTQAEIDKEEIANAQKANLAWVKLYDQVQAINRERKLEALPVEERINVLLLERGRLQATIVKSGETSTAGLEAAIKLGKLDKEIAQQKLEALKAQTAEIEKQNKIEETKRRAAESFGKNGEMFLAGGLAHYDNPLQQQDYERQTAEAYRRQLEDEIAQREKNLAIYRGQSGSYAAYLSQNESSSIEALRYRSAHAYQAVFDPNYSDALGGSVLAQQIEKIGGGGTLGQINENLNTLTTGLRRSKII